MVQNNLKQVYDTSRVLFVIQGCNVCHIWKKFIERENLKIKPGKRISVVDATLFTTYGTYDNFFLRIFDEFLQDPPKSKVYSFPALFIDGRLITGANSQEEALNFIRGLLHDDYNDPYEKYEFKAECDYRKKNGKRVLMCGIGGVEDEE